jgi:hypothetical protein
LAVNQEHVEENVMRVRVLLVAVLLWAGSSAFAEEVKTGILRTPEAPFIVPA